MNKKVIVTGCFDLLHSGHVAFLKEASQFGDLYVCIGNDENVKNLKGRYPVNQQQERAYMLEALACVKEVQINKGWGIIDFEQEMEEIAPDVFVVNEDGHTPNKESLCRKYNIDYKVLSRIPHGNLPIRSTTALRTVCTIPFRIDLAGGWLDQPYVSKYCPGAVLTISIEPTIDFNYRSGMASSTRQKAIELWNTELPSGEKEQLAKVLFAFDNPPGTTHVSGSQDSIGIVFPGLNKLFYNNHYWPEAIKTIDDEDILSWIESHLYLVTLGPRVSSYNVLENTQINSENAKALADAADRCWDALIKKDIMAFGGALKSSFEAQIAMFPNMVDAEIWDIIAQYRSSALGWKLSGAGGGGYLILVSDRPIENAIQIKIRRREGERI
ncbi:MAG: adenylyltransferase/cytidyltransferase family protein [Saprospiraceae bacterium]